MSARVPAVLLVAVVWLGVDLGSAHACWCKGKSGSYGMYPPAYAPAPCPGGATGTPSPGPCVLYCCLNNQWVPRGVFPDCAQASAAAQYLCPGLPHQAVPLGSPPPVGPCGPPSPQTK